MEKYNVNVIAEYIVSKEVMTPKRLQKLLYFCYSYYLVINNPSVDKIENKLFKNEFEAWIHGPVIPQIYRRYSVYGMSEIALDKLIGKNRIDEEDCKLINEVIDLFSNITTYQMEMITHRQLPWKNARKGLEANEFSNEILSDRDIFECFSSLVTDD